MVLNADRQGQLAEELAQALHRRGLSTPAIALLEAHKPLSFVASQALLALSPLMTIVVGRFPIEDYSALLEDSSNVDRVISRLEELADSEAGS